MKNILMLLTLLFAGCFPVFAQTYVEEQSIDASNLLKNAGFEAGLARWGYTSGTVTFVTSGSVSLIQGLITAEFNPTGVSQTVSSRMYLPVGLNNQKCEARISYLTTDVTDNYYFQVVDANSTILATELLATANFVERHRLFFNCQDNPIQIQIVSANATADPIFLDGAYLGLRQMLSDTDISDLLGYTPLSAGFDIDADSSGELPSSRLADSGVAAATYPKVTVNSKGVVTSGTSLIESDVPSLQTTKITSGVFAVERGGTGVSSTTTGDILVGSGTAFVKLPSAASGAVLTSNASGTVEWLTPETNAIVNYASNPSFEQSLVGYTASGTLNLTRSDRSANGVPYLNSDRYYLLVDSATTGEGVCTTNVVPQNMRGSDIEVSAQYRNGFAAAGTWLMTVSAGTMVSQTIVMDSGSGSILTDSFLSSPKIYVGTSSSTATVQTCFLNTSGSAILHLDNAWIGSPRSLKTGAITGPRTQYTPTLTGFGSATNIEFYYWQTGDKIKVTGSLTAGTYSGVEVRVSLPNGWVTKTQTATNMIAGKYGRGDTSTAHGGFVLSQSQKNYVVFGNSGTFSNANANPLSATTALGAASQPISFEFEVSIDGLSGSSTTFDSRCPNDISCTNEFAAFVGSIAAVTQENLDFISSCTKNSTGDYSCTFNTGVFSVTPNCSVSAFTGSDVTVSMNTQSTTTINYKTFNTAGSAADGAVTLRCSKQGSDFVAKHVIEGFLSKTLQTSGLYQEKVVRARYGGATATTVCSANPCTIYGNPSPEILSISWASAGIMAVNFVAGTFATGSIPQCFISPSDNITNIMIPNEISPYSSSAAYPFKTYDASGVGRNSFGSVVCYGVRP